MKDPFESNPKRDAELASNLFNVELERTERDKPDVEVIGELEDLLDQRSAIHVRLRQLTGKAVLSEALHVARELVSESKRPENLPIQEDQTQGSVYPDDRDRSVSVRTLSGGLPTLGKHR